MPTTSFILFPHGVTWQIASVVGEHVSFADMLPPTGDAVLPRAIAERLATELRRLGYAGEGVMLTLPSSQCLAASLDISGLPHGDRKAMLYRFEEKLPLAAESVVADFCISADRALGVCVREDIISPLLNSLEANGIAIQSIAPATLLTAQQVAENGASEILIFGEEHQVNVIRLVDGVPAGWSLIPSKAADLTRQLNLLAMNDEHMIPLRTCGVDAAILQGISATLISTPSRQFAAIAASRILSGQNKPWIDLRRDALAVADKLRLHRSALNALLATAAVFFVCLSVGMLILSHRYNQVADSAQRKIADHFTATFPGWALPSNVKAIVDAEYRKLGVAAAGGLPPHASDSAVTLLQSVLAVLPKDVKYRIESMSFGDAKFDLQGRVRNFVDLESIAAAARRPGIDLPPPEAHRDAEGFWSFTLRGTLSEKKTSIAKQ
jgi:type II secretory pathway component PulL